MTRALLLVARRGIGRRRLQTALATVGIGIGVAAAGGMWLANRAVLDSFRRTAEAVAGRATHQVVAGPSGLPDEVVPAIRRIVDYGVQDVVKIPSFEIGVAPVVEFYAPAEALGGEVVHVLGLDPLMDAEIRSWRPGEGGSLEALLARRDAVALSAPLAARLGADVGDTVRLSIAGRPADLEVVGRFDPGAVSAGGAGEFAVMDIAAAQEWLGEEGRVGRVDLVLPEPTEDEDLLRNFLLHFQDDVRPYVEGRIRDLLPFDAELRTPRDLAGRREAMVRAFRLNLAALSFLALFVGAILAAGAARFSVTLRRREIGVLRLLGATRRGILLAVLGEAAALGALGGAVGAVAARLLASGIVALAARTVSDLYAYVRPEPPRLDLWTFAAGTALGAAAATVAAGAAAVAAARIPPLEGIRRSEAGERAGRRGPARLAAALAVLAGAGAVAAWPTPRPEAGFAAAFLVLLAAALVAPPAVAAAARAAPLVGRLLGPEGLLAGRNLGRAVDRTGAAVAALAVALAMTAAVTIMVRSFRAAVDDWVGQTLQADLYVAPAGRDVAGVEIPLPAEAVGALEGLFPGADVNLVREADVTFGGRPVRLVAMRASVIGGRGGYPIQAGPAAAEAWAALGRGVERVGVARDEAGRERPAIRPPAVMVSEPFARRFGARPGDHITLPTPGGEAPFRVVAVYTDYATDRGAVLMDLEVYRFLWGDGRVNAAGLFLPAGLDSAEALDRARDSLGRRWAVRLRDGRALRAQVLAIFDRTFAVAYALEAIAAAVAALGIAATMTAHVAARTREIGVLRAMGVLRRGIGRMVVAEAAGLGAVGGLLACAAGAGLAVLLVRVINLRSFFWTIPLRLPPAAFAEAVSLAVVGAAVASLWPAARAARLVVGAALREE